MKAEQSRCPTCKRLRKRSNPANARMWLLLHLVADKVRPEGQQYSAESFHAWFKQKFLGMDEIKLPSGKVVQFPKSTAELDSGEFALYLDKIEHYASEKWEVYLEELV
jgi:hypothetical protein